MKSCFFIGHRDADERLLPYLTETTERLITKRGVTRFYVGGYGHFDRNGFMAHTSLKFAFGHNLPYWGLWSFNIGCIYGSGNVGVTFGVSLPIISIIGTAGAASVLYL